MVPKRGVSNLVKDFAMLWGAVPIPEIIGLSGNQGLCVLGRP